MALREAPGAAMVMEAAGAQGDPWAAVATRPAAQARGQAAGPTEARVVATVADSSSTRASQGRLLHLPRAASARCRPSAWSPCAKVAAGATR